MGKWSKHDYYIFDKIYTKLKNWWGKTIYDEVDLSYYEGNWINNRKFGWGIRPYLSGTIILYQKLNYK